MSGPAAVVWDDALAAYDFGPGHPLAPIRVQLAMLLAVELGLLTGEQVAQVKPVPVDEGLLLAVHHPEYVAAVELASADPSYEDVHRGLGTDDVPTFLGMHDASMAVCGATLAAAQAVHSGSALHAVNLAGGLHHAMPDRASGFCVYNDVALAIRWLLHAGVERVAYVDVDVHHGDGVQAMFWDEPRVLTVSLHESGRTLFPGTGWPTETGGPNAMGTKVNVALPMGTGDEDWQRAFGAIVPDVLAAFRPTVLVTQQGCDSHAEDPLAHLALTVDGHRATYAALHRLAHEYCEGRWVATGGGGYSWVDVVPRSWSHLVAEVVGSPLDGDVPVPPEWRAFVQERLGVEAPRWMGDGRVLRHRDFEDGYDPDDPVDAAILATRRAVYPALGIPADHHHHF